VYLVLPKFLAPEKPSAVWMLSECGQPAVPLLLKCLHREDPVIRGVAIMALGEIGPLASEATPALEVTATNDTEVRVREAAREALKKIKGEEPPK